MNANTNEIRRPWKPRTKLTVSILILVLFIYLLSRFSAAIPPFILALILAFVLTPAVNKMEEQLPISRGLITGLVFLVILTLVCLIPVVFLPPLGEQIADLNLDFQLLLEQLLGHQYIIAGQTIDRAAIFNQIVSVVQEILQPLFEETLGFAVDEISSLVWVVPFAFAMGVLAGLMEFLPSIGHGIWLTIATILALFAGSTWMNLPNWIFSLIIIGLHVVFQQFDLNYLIPRIIGRQVHLPPLMVILGIVAGAAMAGVLGVLLAAPTVASARVIGRYIFANLTDADPFPEMATSPLPPPNPRWWSFGGKFSSEDLNGAEV